MVEKYKRMLDQELQKILPCIFVGQQRVPQVLPQEINLIFIKIAVTKIQKKILQRKINSNNTDLVNNNLIKEIRYAKKQLKKLYADIRNSEFSFILQ